MLTFRMFPGGWYGAAVPSGAYAVQVPFSKIETDRGLVDLPPNETWGVQIYDILPDGTFAGLGHTGNGNVWEYVPGPGWHRLEYISGRGKYKGNQWVDLPPAMSGGTGFIDDTGNPISRLDTYEANRGLNNWTETGGLLFGQGNPDKGAPCEGLLLWDGRNYRVLHAGSCQEPVIKRMGELFALTFREDGVGVHSGTFTRQQLLAEPVVNPQPPEPPEPPEPPMPNPLPNKSAFVTAFIGPRLKKLATEDATRANSFEAVNACCNALRSEGDMNWGLLEKTSGDRVKDRATDILLYALGDGTAQVVDVVNNAEGADGGTPSPAWSVKDIRPISQWRQPYPVGPKPTPDDTLARIVVLEQAVMVLSGDLKAAKQEIAGLAFDLNALKNRVDQIPNDLPNLIARFEGNTQPAGASFLRHSHRIQLDVPVIKKP